MARDPIKALATEGGRPTLRDRGRSYIGRYHGRREDPAGSVHGHEGFALARDPQRLHGIVRDRDGRLGDDFSASGADFLRIEFRPAVWGMTNRVFPISEGQLHPVFTEDDRLASRGSDIQTHVAHA